MSEVTALTVHCIQIKDNFVHLHSKQLKKFTNSKNIIGCVKIECNDVCNFGSCYSTPFNGNGENALNISTAYANTLGVSESEIVIISNVETAEALKVAYITPISKDDWDILESTADVIQTTLLNQIRIIHIHQILSVWITKSFSLKVHIDRLDGGVNFGKLEQYTEVVVSENVEVCNNCPLPAKNLSKCQDTANRSFWDFSFFKDIFSLEKSTEKSPDSKLNDQCEYDVLNVGVFRCSSLNDLLFNYRPDSYDYPYNIFVSKKHFNKHILHSNCETDFILCRLTHVTCNLLKVGKKNLAEKNEELTFINNEYSIKQIYVHLFTIEETDAVVDDTTYTLINCYPTVFVSKTVQHFLKTKKNSKVKLELIINASRLENLSEINFTVLKSDNNIPKENIADDLKNYFRCYANSHDKLILNNYCIYIDGKSCNPDRLYITFNPANVPFVELCAEQIENCNFHPVEQKINVDFDYVTEKVENNLNLLQFNFLQKIVEKLKSHLLFKLNLARSKTSITENNNTILEGDAGCGKSSVLNILCQQLSQLHYGIFIKKLECKTLKGKLTTKLKKIFELALVECVCYQPAVLCLDDLDALFVSSKLTNQQPSESSTASYSSRLSNVMYDMVHLYSKHHVAIIATASKILDFNPCLFNARGSSLFTNSVRIPSLNQEMREELFVSLLRNKCNNIPNFIFNSGYLQKVSQRIEGYCIQDIADLVDRIYFEIIKRQIKTHRTFDLPIANENDINEAITDMVPMSFKGIDFHKNSDVTWSNVGGLEMAKQRLTEILVWPSQYPKIFEQCPLKIQSGTILFGAPGSGKTLLASAVAGESCLNFISIKGPELLSKFVGESEEGVRNIFQKAQSAKPCILFFDEFDSLAPKRGNDITGVTDRVVNQFLTELDGVESVSGVWVLAATSRPDLIDPALLRPGRLGTSIYCSLPNKAERLSILKTLNIMNLCNDSDLNAIANVTDGYTGADLKAVLYTAYMNSNSFRQNITELSSHGDNEFIVSAEALSIQKISEECLMSAVRSTKPSLNPAEIEMYEKIYKRFLKIEHFELEANNQRVTYA